jgi:hypothetical protein
VENGYFAPFDRANQHKWLVRRVICIDVVKRKILLSELIDILWLIEKEILSEII